MQNRILRLDVCDYENTVLCNLYDSHADISGQATEVFIRTERNGWSELSFILPSLCEGENGLEENYRLKYLIADYRIRAMDENGIDWFIITEPKITHDKFSKKTSVLAGNICQLLKTKNMALEFSDEEGNNVGTAEQLLKTILDGTGWLPGYVYPFAESYAPYAPKVRSLVDSAKTGAFKLITDMCALFDAKPVFRNHVVEQDDQGNEVIRKYVDIYPMNPFSEVEEGQLPSNINKTGTIAADDAFELHYDRNMHNITRILNTENLITVLYAYGSYGDESGMCSLQTCDHTELTFNVPAHDEPTEYSFEYEDAVFYFTFTISDHETQVIWSTLDAASKSYVWNETDEVAYRVYKEPKSTWTELTYTEEKVRNYFPSIMDFTYYDHVGLLSDAKLQLIAKYQREVPALLAASENAADLFTHELLSLSLVGEHNTGFLRFDVNRYTTSRDGFLQLNLDSSEYEEGVVYRSDYLEARRKYFPWHPAQELKENGDPVSGIGSVVYMINSVDYDIPRWEKYYIRSLGNAAGEYYARSDNGIEILVTNDNTISRGRKELFPATGQSDKVYHDQTTGKYYIWNTDSTIQDHYIPLVAADFKYELTEFEPPTHITIWAKQSTINGQASPDNDLHFFLFCTNSISGDLGVKESEDEAARQSLSSSTKTATELHPTYFIWEDQDMPSPLLVQETYGWTYRSTKYDNNLGQLYFCNGKAGETEWHYVYILDQKDPPAYSDGRYFYSLRTKNLYHADSNSWIKFEDTDGKRIAKQFNKVVMAGLKHDMLYKGVYETYTYPVTTELTPGSYAIENEYGYYWAFSTDIPTRIFSVDPSVHEGSIWVDSVSNNVFQTGSMDVFAKAEFKSPDVLTFPNSNELTDSTFSIGSIDRGTHKEYSEQGSYRSNEFISISPNTRYKYSLPPNSYVVFTRTASLNTFLSSLDLTTDVSGKGEFMSPVNAHYLRLCTTSQPSNLQFIKAYDSTNILENIAFEMGSIVYDNIPEGMDRGDEIPSETMYRCGYMSGLSGNYKHSLPTGSFVLYYNSSKQFMSYSDLSAKGEFDVPQNTGFVRFLCPVIPASYQAVRGSNQPNLLTGVTYAEGSIDKGTHQEVVVSDAYRSNYISTYPNTTYEYSLPANSYAILYTSSKFFNSLVDLTGSTAGTGTFHTGEKDKYIRIVSSAMLNELHQYYVRVQDYDHIFYLDDVKYKVLGKAGDGTIQVEEPRIGINTLIKQFDEIANETYLVKLPALLNAQEIVKEKNNAFSVAMGDLFREGWWQDNSYIEGDEARLYADATDNLEKIAKPEARYDFTFLDLFGSNQSMGYSVNDMADVEYPDIKITDAVHLVDPEIDVNCWGFIDKLEKCYDQPWKTKVEINTNLSLIGQKSFTDVLAHIADVAKETKAKQSLYARAATLTSSGMLAASKLEGAISTAKSQILGGSSNWYTNDKGAIVIESADGNSAMMLTGAGFLLANTKDEHGDWNWRTAGTGSGMSADEINTGTLSAVLIEAGGIVTDQLHASVGQELDIGSNKALLLYATEDGARPAGTVKTTDALITIAAGSGQTPARINIESGGELKLNGANIDINATGQMRLSSGSTFEIKSGADFLITSDNFTINKDANGKYTVKLKGEVVADSGRIAGFTLREVYNGSTLDHRYLYSGDTTNLNYSTASNYKGVYIGTDGVNFGGILKISSNGQTSELRMAASNIIIGDNNSLSNQITTLNTGISNAATAASNAATVASNAQTAANNARTVATGTKLKIDANAGTIEVSATSTLSFLANQSINITSGGTINLASGKELNLVTDGKIRIGHTSYPFVISKDNLGGPNGNINRSYIYAYNSSYASGNTRNVTSIRDVTTSSIAYKGIYLGTDGINLGGKFRVDQDGKLTATSGTFSGDITGASGTFSGSITGATGTIGGWSITSAGISNGSITLGNGGTITGNGFTLNSTGLTIPSGTVITGSDYGSTVENALTAAQSKAIKYVEDLLNDVGSRVSTRFSDAASLETIIKLLARHALLVQSGGQIGTMVLNSDYLPKTQSINTMTLTTLTASSSIVLDSGGRRFAAYSDGSVYAENLYVWYNNQWTYVNPAKVT